jgi:hypothetical protein
MYAQSQDDLRYHRTARCTGLSANGSRSGDGQHRRSTGLLLWLLRLCAVCLLTLWILRTGLFLQRHLPGYGPMGWLGIRSRLGRPSLQQWGRRKLSRGRRRCGQSQQFCSRGRRQRAAYDCNQRRSASQHIARFWIESRRIECHRRASRCSQGNSIACVSQSCSPGSQRR